MRRAKPNRATRRSALAVRRRSNDPWRWEDRSDLVAQGSPVLGWGRFSRATANGLYSVQVYERETGWGQVDHLAIRRHDNGTALPWADLQRIKDDLAGPDRLAIEVFPPAGQLVDEANLFHLWILPRGFVLPFGLNGGLVG